MQMLERFAAVIETGAARLSEVSHADASHRFESDSWSRREELGHLIDSAVNNYARIVRTQNEASPQLPGYTQDFWVERAGYHEREWKELIALWKSLNQHFLATARRIPAATLERRCTIGGGPSITLGFVIEDYVDHMVHHLEHIGVAVREYRRPESVYA